MAVEYQYTNRFQWTSVYDQTFTGDAVLPSLTRYHPIPKITLPFTIDSQTIAVYCANPQAEGNWRYGARYFAQMETSLAVGLINPKTVVKTGKIYLDQIEIIQFPPFASTYTFEIDIPYWHREFHLKVWEYDGSNSNTVQDKLDQILASLAA